MPVTITNRPTYGFKVIGLRNFILLAIFLFSSFLIYSFFPNQGLEWISFVLCSFIIGLANLFILGKQTKLFSSNVKGFLLFRILWSLTFSFYMLLIFFTSFHGLGLSFLLIFFIAIFFDVLANILFQELNNSLGPPFIPFLS